LIFHFNREMSFRLRHGNPLALPMTLERRPFPAGNRSANGWHHVLMMNRLARVFRPRALAPPAGSAVLLEIAFALVLA